MEEPVILNRGAETNLAEQGLVMAVFPNPAIDETMVYFELGESAEFRLTAYDMAGRVRMVVDQPGEKGENTLRLDTRSWSPGLYWLKLQTGQDEKIKSLMIQR